jgi:NAD/NADP transhydrogenase alpha subunit
LKSDAGSAADQNDAAFNSTKAKVEEAYQSAVSDVKAKIEKAKSEALKKIQQHSPSS